MWIAMVVVMLASGAREAGIYNDLEFISQAACEEAAPALTVSVMKQLDARRIGYTKVLVHCEKVK